MSSETLTKQEQATHINSYKKTEVMTSNKEKILLLMYQAAIRFLKKAIEATQNKDDDTRTEYVKKTHDIVAEFRATLNYEAGGDIARHLDKLYDFVTRRLVEGNLHKKVDYFQDALKVLETLHSGWEEAIASIQDQKKSAKG